MFFMIVKEWDVELVDYFFENNLKKKNIQKLFNDLLFVFFVIPFKIKINLIN